MEMELGHTLALQLSFSTALRPSVDFVLRLLSVSLYLDLTSGSLI